MNTQQAIEKTKAAYAAMLSDLRFETAGQYVVEKEKFLIEEELPVLGTAAVTVTSAILSEDMISVLQNNAGDTGEGEVINLRLSSLGEFIEILQSFKDAYDLAQDPPTETVQ